MTEKQIWARKRNWLIMRLMGAKSIFSYDNTVFMGDLLQDERDNVFLCETGINDLLNALRKTKQD